MATLKFTQKFPKNSFEKRDWADNKVICGIDEVGRACLAGPVMVGAVILHPYKMSPLIKDSKEMTAQERQKAYAWIVKNSWHAIALVDHKTVDTHNIYQATLITMKRAFLQLMASCPLRPSTVLVDAMPLSLNHTHFEEIDVLHFPFGESKSISIAAASILAKVTRDKLMSRFDSIFYDYGFAHHKGYGTPEHQHAVKTKGHTIIHRVNFIKGAGLFPSNDEQNQQISFINQHIEISESTHE